LCRDNRKLIRIYYYNAPLNINDNKANYQSQQRFFSSIQKTPFVELKLGRLEPRQDGHSVEKGVDVMLAVDMLKYAIDQTYDTAILVSGDGDFKPAVDAVKDLGKHVEHAYFAEGATALRKASDNFIILDNDYLSDCFK
jgi:uncharacterized LabA/DUF88 family protein